MHSFLLIRFSSIGDVVLTSPVIRCLRAKFPNAQIDFLTREPFAPLVQHNPHVNRVYTFKKDISEVLPQLKEANHTYLIDLHKNLRSALLKMRLSGLVFTFHKLNFRKWLHVRLKIAALPAVHIVDRYLDALETFGVKNDEKGLELFIPNDALVPIEALPPSHRSGFIAFAIGAAHFTKRLPDRHWLSMGEKCPYPIVLMGGKEDKERGDALAKAIGNKAYNAAGAFNLLQSASIIQHAMGVVSNDTGLMHMAAAFQKPIVSLWGNTVPAFGMWPYEPQNSDRIAIVENTSVTCRPCSKIGYQACPKKHFQCMESLNPDVIIEALNKTLESN